MNQSIGWRINRALKLTGTDISHGSNILHTAPEYWLFRLADTLSDSPEHPGRSISRYEVGVL